MNKKKIPNTKKIFCLLHRLKAIQKIFLSVGLSFRNHAIFNLDTFRHLCYNTLLFFTEKTSSKPKTVTEIISPVSPSVVAAPEFAEYENMYKRGEWNCYMCSKWFSRCGIK